MLFEYAQLVFCSLFSDSMHGTMYVSLFFLFYCTLCTKYIVRIYIFKTKPQRIPSMITCWMYRLYKKCDCLLLYLMASMYISCASHNVWWLLNTDRKWFSIFIVLSMISFIVKLLLLSCFKTNHQIIGEKIRKNDTPKDNLGLIINNGKTDFL